MAARIVLITGACGTGKTSVSQELAEHAAHDRAAHIHTDDFYRYIRKGYLEPWMDGTGEQNETVIRSAAASAESFLAGGYEVYVDGVIGPWFLKPWMQIAETGVDVRYVVLRPDERTTVARALERGRSGGVSLDRDVVEKLWRSFSNLGEYEANALDTSTLTINESVKLIQKRLYEGDFRLL